MIADRTAIESRPSKDGVIHLISDKTREVKIPGYVIKPRSGHSALASDHNFIGGLKICSRERALLENIRLSRGQTSFLPKTLTQNELENKLENILTTEGEEALNTLRDKAYKISNEIKEPDLYKKLNHLIGLFLGTRKGEGRNPLLWSRQKGLPFDPKRINLFEKLYTSLKKTPPQFWFRNSPLREQNEVLAFYEAYFSNFIEGTEFEIEEAEEIIFEKKFF